MLFQACASNPCSNNGVCSSVGDLPVCTCKFPFVGPFCQQQDVCLTNP